MQVSKTEEILRAARQGIKKINKDFEASGLKFQDEMDAATCVRWNTLWTLIDTLEARRGSFEYEEALRKLRGV